jgi:hypothetical protein
LVGAGKHHNFCELSERR